MEDIVWVQETRDLVSRLGGHVNKKYIESLLYLYLIEEDPREKLRLRNLIESLLSIDLPEYLFGSKMVLECPEQEVIDGAIKIGKVTRGETILGTTFGLSNEEINQHLVIFARSGAGKTTLIMRFIDQFIASGIPFLVFDFKLDYRHLVKLYPQLVVLKWTDLRINLLSPPPDVSIVEWKQQFINIFGHVEGIWKGSTQFLLEAIDQVYNENNGRIKIEDVYNKVKSSRETTRKFQDYSSVVETRLYGILSTLGETVNNYRNILNVEELLKHPVVLELDGLERNSANLIILWLFYWIYAYRRAKGIRGKLLHVLILDEAKRVFTASEMYSQTTAEYSGIPPADLICDEIRDFGEAIIASDQEPSKISDSLKANTYTKITSYLGNGKDLANISEAMDLGEEERQALANLERGEWLVKLAGRYTKPFTMKSIDIPLEKDVTDEEIRVRMKPMLLELMSKENESVSSNKQTNIFPEISDDAWSLLSDVNYHPFKGLVARYQSLKLSVRKASLAKDELVNRNLVEEVDIRLGVRRPTKFLVPTNLGLTLLRENNEDVGLWNVVGRQGFEHQLYSVLIMYTYRKSGCEAYIEKVIEDRRIDVLVVIGEKRIAVEVELSDIDIEEKSELLHYVDSLLVVVKEEDLSRAKLISDSLPLDKRERVEVYSITQFLRQIPSNYRVEVNGNNPSSQNESSSDSVLRNKSETWGL